jgi:hypothetical protein
MHNDYALSFPKDRVGLMAVKPQVLYDMPPPLNAILTAPSPQRHPERLKMRACVPYHTALGTQSRIGEHEITDVRLSFLRPGMQ